MRAVCAMVGQFSSKVRVKEMDYEPQSSYPSVPARVERNLASFRTY